MALSLDVSKTALVLIDLEAAIVGRDLAPYTGAEVVTHARTLADSFRSRGGAVIFVHVLIGETVPPKVDSPTPASGSLPPHATEIVPEAGMQAGDVLIAKRQWGAFYGTNLEQTLDRRGIETIILCGIATNLGVESTARAAFDAGYSLVFAEDAMSSISKEWHEFAVKELFPKMGHVRSTGEIVAAL